MTTLGTLRVGRLILKENFSISDQVNATTGESSVSLTGREIYPQAGVTDAMILSRQEDFIGMLDRSVPVTFSVKSNNDGYYVVHDVGATLTKWEAEATFLDWTLSLQRVGAENAVDQESRVAAVVRANDFALSGERWLAPPPAHYAFYSGSNPSGSVLRPLADSEGTIKVYRGVPANFNPRWGVTPTNYLAGRSRILVGGVERTGVAFRISDPLSWQMSNGLIRVTPMASAGLINIEAWDGTSWEGKAWDVSVGSAIGAFEAATVLRNDFEMTTIRLVDSLAPGRTLLDITLRRGSRFVECFLQTVTSATLGAHLHTNETTTNNAASGYVVATANDAAGNKFVAGSARTFTGDTTGGLSKATSTSLGFFIGLVLNGSSAISGDAATDLRDQYIGAMSETVAAVRR
jgi:hypothetical protein